MRVAVPALLAVLFVPLAAEAHGLGVQATVKPGMVRVEVFYDDDTPGSGATVRVFNAANEQILEGTADANGVWEFPAPPPGEYSVRAKTDDGHKSNKETFTVRPADAPPPPEPTTRAVFTGPLKWLLVAAALAMIGLGFTTFYFFVRAMRTKRTPPG